MGPYFRIIEFKYYTGKSWHTYLMTYFKLSLYESRRSGFGADSLIITDSKSRPITRVAPASVYTLSEACPHTHGKHKRITDKSLVSDGFVRLLTQWGSLITSPFITGPYEIIYPSQQKYLVQSGPKQPIKKSLENFNRLLGETPLLK